MAWEIPVYVITMHTLQIITWKRAQIAQNVPNQSVMCFQTQAHA